ncbi:MAG: hypothetical protein KAR83_07670 [Thermodesulfovibrionales bacterium]|nr:hypothetical protein [Thermodesulfovibrionales bacterium]
MKNQYYGDISDFIKYAMLRHLSVGGNYRLGINWYLTEDDNSTDGKKIKYLEQPNKWQEYDSTLFVNLYESVIKQKKRKVSRAEVDIDIGNAVFYDSVTPDAKDERKKWFENSLKTLNNCELIFLDPDNGLSVKSVAYGRKKSSKFVYDHELKSLWDSGKSKSIVLYQHFPMIERKIFMDDSSKRISDLLGCSRVICLKTAHVVFFVIPCKAHAPTISNLCKEFSNRRPRVVEQSVWAR